MPFLRSLLAILLLTACNAGDRLTSVGKQGDDEPATDCTPLTCEAASCPAGFKQDENGCPTCECAPVPSPCDLVQCEAGTHCVVVGSAPARAQCVEDEDTSVDEPCGVTTCGPGFFCCNPSCGICAEDGGVCLQSLCDE